MTETLYVIMGIDKDEHDQVLALFKTFEEAKRYCCRKLVNQTEYFDIWLEKHFV